MYGPDYRMSCVCSLGYKQPVPALSVALFFSLAACGMPSALFCSPKRFSILEDSSSRVLSPSSPAPSSNHVASPLEQGELDLVPSACPVFAPGFLNYMGGMRHHTSTRQQHLTQGKDITGSADLPAPHLSLWSSQWQDCS